MRAAPEDLPAVPALTEFRFCFTCVWREQVAHFVLRYRVEGSIAIHAALERGEMGLQRETPCHSPKLFMRLLAAYAIAHLYFASLQKPNIPRQQNTSFRPRDRSEQGIIREPVVPGIKAEHAQVSC